MPCLNESATIATCIQKANRFLLENQIDGEVLISDNGSTDGSTRVAEREGARVVIAEQRGYGAALIKGCQEARGKYVIMGDADDSYDFSNLVAFVEKLREGYDLVMGNRFAGGIEKDAMPWLHKYIGNPVLSFVGRLFFRSNIRDFHCGLRGYNKQSIQKLELHTTGMEYASEMVVMAQLNGLRITEVPTTLKKDGRNRAPHLRTFRDGWRHLKFLLMYAPDWLFLYPAITLLFVGVLLSCILLAGSMRIGTVTLSIHTLLYSFCFVVVGYNVLNMYLLVKLYAYNHNFLPNHGGMSYEKVNWNHKVKEDIVILSGVIFVFIGVGLSIYAFLKWGRVGWSDLLPEEMMRLVIPAASLLEMGIQGMFFGFLMGIMKIRRSDD
ncbi:MAG: glycosyltransferase family 2 protein [Lachnospiraceae bacterium]|nr:glycosyltransferase family 2 protein [Lachnospiraceae bacterium]